MAGKIFKAVESFSVEWEGKPLVVERGCTAREGHPLLVAYPHLFTELAPVFEHVPPAKPEAPAKPQLPAKKVAAAPTRVKAEGT
ncbi:hypothetical protein [Streptomyces roseolus]|uniref:hypothetical protein n=1 Tax=Streptomyces roseolus TaxID=67358 RepID=UPI001679DD1E|nr:hypothetical protein [Streptomyces roseolus]